MQEHPPLWEDTHPDIAARLVEGYRQMSPVEKVRRVVALTQGVQQMALARLRLEYPNDTERQRQLRLASLWIDAETMRAAFSWDPDIEGR